MNDSSEVKLHFLDYWRVIRVRWAVLVITFFLVMATAGVVCFFLPRQYYSRVTMEVKSDNTQFQVFSNDSGGIQTIRDPNLQATQFQIIQSKEILYPVIDNLKLVEAWSAQEGGSILPKEEVYARLLKRITLTPVRNTDLIEIGIASTDRVEAANIANMIAVVYQKVRREDQMQIRESALAQLKEEVANQRKTVDATQTEMQKLRVRDHIVDPNPESLEAPESLTKTIVTDEEKQYNDSKIRHAEMQVQLEQTAKLKPEELMTALTQLNIQDPTIGKILPQYQETASEEARLLNGGLGENHPRLKSLRAQKEVFTKQLNDAIAAVRNSLAIKLKMSEGNLAAMKEKIDMTRERFNNYATRDQEYITTKQNYINAKRLLDEAERRLSTQSVQLKMSVYPAKIWEKAEPAIYPQSQVLTYMIGAAVVGLVFGTLLAFFIEYLDTSVKTLDDIERYLKLPVLAVIPKGVTTLFKLEGDGPDAEAYRILRTNMEFNCKNPNAKTITLVSGGPGEGKSTTLNNLAVTCAKGGYRVLIVDADLRRPAQHSFFDMENDMGISEVLTGSLQLEKAIKATSLPNLFFLPCGNLPEDAAGILNSQSMIDLIESVRASYDLIFFDSPPILGVSDASILASEVDIAIMVVQYRRFPRAMLQRVKGAVENVGGHLLGIVLNNVETRHDSAYQYYTQYYDYYTPDAERRKRKAIKQVPVGESIPEKVTRKSEEY